MSGSERVDRRSILIAGVMGAAAAGLGACAGSGGGRAGAAESRGKEDKDKQGGEEDVAPAEDLMREHGVLNRVLLVYEECARRIEARQDLNPEPLADAAGIVRTFIEDYHEKLEEDHLFPRYRAANRLVDLVETLTVQHRAGRVVTERIEGLATVGGLRDADSSRELVMRIGQFVRMYRPHEAREDTVLFPALHEIVSRNEYDAMGEDFERIERTQLGQEGFERAVERVAEIERRLGIYELGQFTPPVR